MTFAAATLPAILVLLAIPLTADNYAVVSGVLDAIEALDNGAMVEPIESLLTQIQSIDAAIDTQSGNSSMIQADVVKWQGGAGAGRTVRYRTLKAQLLNLLGFQDPLANGVSMVRSDAYSLTHRGSLHSYHDDWRLIAW